VHTVVFAKAQKARKVEETLNKFKRTHLVSRKMGRCTGWGGRRWESRRGSGYSVVVCEGLEGSES